MTTDNKYNGWTNYETWNVALWMDQDADFWNEQSVEFYKAAEADKSFTKEERAALDMMDMLKDLHEKETPTVTGVYADLLNAALSSVNWYEIAKHQIDGVVSEVA